MKFREKLQMEHPDHLFNGIPEGCPHLYGYEGFAERPCNGAEAIAIESCTKCWNREMPNAELTKEFDVATQGYSKGYSVGRDDGYNKGLSDAWELAKKVSEFDGEELCKIFGVYDALFDEEVGYFEMVMKLTPQEALAKLKAYEDSKIEVGDVVKDEEGWEYVVTNIYKDRDSCRYNGVTSCGKWTGCCEPTKTGKHIDIKSILEQIGE